MTPFHPYTDEELRHLRRLILASGSSVEAWAARLHRAAGFLQSLSPSQAEVVAQQAIAIAAAPHDYGPEEALRAVRAEIAGIPEGERLRYVSRHVIATRRRHFPGRPDEP
jgi:hypothetical protein